MAETRRRPNGQPTVALVEVAVRHPDETLRQEVFERWLDAELRRRYLRHLANRRGGLEKALAVAGAVAGSAAFVTWTQLQSPAIGAWLSLATAVVTGLTGVYVAKSPVSAWRELNARWTRRHATWRALWLDLQRNDPPSWDTVKAEMAQDVALHERDGDLPENKKVIRSIQKSIKHSEGLE